MYTNGDTLANGYEVIQQARDVVLAQDGEKFATWMIDGMGATYWGHYFRSLPEAIADFHQRYYSGR